MNVDGADMNDVAVERDAEHDLRIVPVIREEAQVEKRMVETGTVRIDKTVREEEQVVDEPLFREEIVVERVPVNRMVEGPIPTREEGDVTIVSVTKEVLVVEKRLMLTEEVRITRRRTEFHAPQRVVLHREEVAVERTPIRQDGGPTGS